MKKIAGLFLFFLSCQSFGQDTYKDSIKNYLAQYVEKHEVITGAGKQFFRFFPIDEKYRVLASFERVADSKWFNMERSGTIKKAFRVYGTLHFTINDTNVSLNLYQSQNLMNVSEYNDYLFLPFTDLGSGEESYTAGRYIDLKFSDIKNDKVVIDFNKAYNPYCAYVSGKYNCPIPPQENHLPVAIPAGEKNFAKH